MANFDKLQEGQARLSPEQRRENARLAGIASGEARQRRKLMRETATGILKAPAAIPEIAAALEKAGFDNSYQSAIMLAAIQKAACGDIEAARFVRDTIGEKPTDQFNIAAVQRPIQEMDLSQLSDAELQSLIRSADDSEY